MISIATRHCPTFSRVLSLLTFTFCHFTFAFSASAFPFLVGGDVSLAPTLEQSGVTFKDGGQPTDIFTVFRAHGANCIRLRLFVQPNGRAGVVNDLASTVALARRVKAAGLLFSLDFHYSDTWADPGHQSTPAAWADLPPDALATRLRTYTADALRAFQVANAAPDIVQIGNEITPGFLWPTGKIVRADRPAEAGFDAVATLLRAGIDGVRDGTGPGAPMPKIMLHIDGGESRDRARWFFDAMTRRDVPFDLIGLSYYPFYKGKLADLRRTLDFVATTYHKPVAVVETAYLHADDGSKPAESPGLEFPRTPEGQRDFLAAVIQTVRATPDGLGAGVLYWYPESVPVRSPAVNDWYGGKAAMFDRAGNALPAFGAFK